MDVPTVMKRVLSSVSQPDPTKSYPSVPNGPTKSYPNALDGPTKSYPSAPDIPTKSYSSAPDGPTKSYPNAPWEIVYLFIFVNFPMQ